jgi:Increased loss of mitochondrial DNA protein 1
MVLLTSYTLLLTHSLSTLTISYLLLTSPSTILSSQSLWILGESMHIRPLSLSTKTLTSSMSAGATTPSEPLAMAALVLALSALTQAFFAGGLAPITLSATARSSRPKTEAERRATRRELGEKVVALRWVQGQWMGLAGIRVLLMAMLAAWIYVFHSERSRGSTFLAKTVVSGFGLLANRVVFTAAMTDMLFWGYVWTVIREEGTSVLEMIAKMREDGGQME